MRAWASALTVNSSISCQLYFCGHMASCLDFGLNVLPQSGNSQFKHVTGSMCRNFVDRWRIKTLHAICSPPVSWNAHIRVVSRCQPSATGSHNRMAHWHGKREKNSSPSPFMLQEYHQAIISAMSMIILSLIPQDLVRAGAVLLGILICLHTIRPQILMKTLQLRLSSLEEKLQDAVDSGIMRQSDTIFTNQFTRDIGKWVADIAAWNNVLTMSTIYAL